MPGKNSETDSSTGEEKRSVWREILSWIEVIVIAVVLALAIDNFIIINATVPSGSMEKTILTGSRVLGTRFSYWFSEPQRGDIVIFKFPDDEKKDYLKRIIGLPGDTVEIVDGKVYINNESEPLNDSFCPEEPHGNFGPYIVPANCYFVMGDNRNNSHDSRYWQNTFVREDQILGKAFLRYWPASRFGKIS
jgi:signal peptidase I